MRLRPMQSGNVVQSEDFNSFSKEGVVWTMIRCELEAAGFYTNLDWRGPWFTDSTNIDLDLLSLVSQVAR